MPIRVEKALRNLALVVADEPEVAAACTTALLTGSDPDRASGPRPHRPGDPPPDQVRGRPRHRPARGVGPGDDVLRRAGQRGQRRLHLPPDRRPAQLRRRPHPGRRHDDRQHVGPPLLDPYDYDFHEDPYPYYRRLRDEAPLYRNEEQKFWALSRHADVVQGFRNSTSLSNKHGVSLDPISRNDEAHRVMSFLALDDPGHLRLRTLVSKGFTPRRIRELEGRVVEIAVQHLDAALQSGPRSTTSTTSRASCRWTSSPN